MEKNRQLVTDRLVEFEKQPVQVQDFKKITDHFRGIYRILEDVNMWPVRLANIRISTDYAQKSPRSLFRSEAFNARQTQYDYIAQLSIVSYIAPQQ